MDIFHTAIYVPIYNLLVLLADIIPGGDLGLAVIAVTIAVKFVFLPLSLSAAKTQKAMKLLEPELKALKETYKDDKEKQAREMLALYKRNDVKPFSSILMILVQIPIIFGLYFVCLNVAKGIDPSLLYSFIPAPEQVSVLFLGTFSVATGSIVLAVIAGLSQLLQAWYVIPIPPKNTSGTPSMQEDFGRALALQARFMLPVLIGLFAYTSGAIALYFAASNLFMVAQEAFVRHSGKTTGRTPTESRLSGS